MCIGIQDRTRTYTQPYTHCVADSTGWLRTMMDQKEIISLKIRGIIDECGRLGRKQEQNKTK